MRNIILIFAALFIFNLDTIQAQNISTNEFYINIPSKPNVFINDSILNIIVNQKLKTENNFIIKDTMFNVLLQKIGKLNEVWLFNWDGYKIKLYEGVKCVNNTMLLSSLTTSNYNVDSTVTLNTIMNFLIPISETIKIENIPTVVLFWSTSTGIKKEDNPFDWERIIQKKYNSEVNIMKVNLDVNDSWSTDKKKEFLAMYQTIINIYKEKTIID